MIYLPANFYDNKNCGDIDKPMKSAYTFLINFIKVKFNNNFVIPNQKKEQRAVELSQLYKDEKKGGLAFFGDSIIAGWKTEIFYSDLHYNLGIGGDFSARALARFENNIVHLQPKTIFINLGNNDIKYGYSLNTAVRNLQKIIDLALFKITDVKIILNSAPPVNKKVNSFMPGLCTNKKINRLNEKYKTLITSYQNPKKVIFIDTNNLLKDENGDLNKKFTSDGMHISDEAYQIIFDNLKNLL